MAETKTNSERTDIENELALRITTNAEAQVDWLHMLAQSAADSWNLQIEQNIARRDQHNAN